MPEQTSQSRPMAHNLLNGEDERFPPLPLRDYVGRRPIQALIDRPMCGPQPPMAWLNENTAPNRQSQSVKRQQFRPRVSMAPLDIQLRQAREEIEELLQAVRSLQRTMRNLENKCANHFRTRHSHTRSPNASD